MRCVEFNEINTADTECRVVKGKIVSICVGKLVFRGGFKLEKPFNLSQDDTTKPRNGFPSKRVRDGLG